MTFQPIIAGTGFAGWAFFNRTLPQQQAVFSADTSVQNDIVYFRENITTVENSADLVTDRRLLSFALGAFGLKNDVDSTAFVKRLLDDGRIDPEALSNKLTDKRYGKFVEAMEPLLLLGGTLIGDEFVEEIVTRYETQEFEIAVGQQNEIFRLAMNVDRELQALTAETMSADAMWFNVMGNAPMRSVFETALGLPTAVGKLDIDQQLGIFRERAEQAFGSGEISEFNTKSNREKLVQRFLLMEQLSAVEVSSPGQLALQLLQNGISAR